MDSIISIPNSTSNNGKLLKYVTIIEFVILTLAFLNSGILNHLLALLEFHTFLFYVTFYLGALSGWILIFLIPIFPLIVIIQLLLIFRNIFSRQNIKSSLLALVLNVTQPFVILNIYYKVKYFLQVRGGSIDQLFYQSANEGVYHYSLSSLGTSIEITLLFLGFQIIFFYFFLSTYKKHPDNLTDQDRKIKVGSWIGSVIVTSLLFGIFFGSGALINQSIQHRLTNANIEFRLKNARISGDAAKPLQGIEISQALPDKAQGNKVKLIFSNIPPQVQIGTGLFVFALSPTYTNQPSHDHMESACVVQKDTQTNTFWCLPEFGSLGPNFMDQSIYTFYVDSKITGDPQTRDNQRKSNIDVISKVLLEYKENNGHFPSNQYGSAKLWSVTDPLSAHPYYGMTNYYYYVSTDQKTAIVYARLETTSQDNDPDYYCSNGDGKAVVISYEPDPFYEPKSCSTPYIPGRH